MDIELLGLDGANPLGFLAALGALAAASASASAFPPRLAWQDIGRWTPTLTTDRGRAELVDLLVADLESWRGSSIFSLRYPKREEAADKLEHDLKAPPAAFRKFLAALLASDSPERRRALRHASAFGAEGVTDNNGKTKPLALHFTAGQQEFLGMVAALLGPVQGSAIGREQFEEALFGPWRYSSPLPVLGWDSTSSRDYALRARDPSTDKKLGVPGADWLAFRALGYLRSFAIGGRLSTTGCSGGWKNGAFHWPIWTAPATAPTVEALLNLGFETLASPRERAARGIACVLQAAVRRSDQGGYGSFSPAREPHRLELHGLERFRSDEFIPGARRQKHARFA
jgi:hypothetical protein